MRTGNKLYEILDKNFGDRDDLLGVLCHFIESKNLDGDLIEYIYDQENKDMEEALHYDEQLSKEGPCCQCGDVSHTCQTCLPDKK